MRFELTTPTLARLCSTTELRPLKTYMRLKGASSFDRESGLMAQKIYQIKLKNGRIMRFYLNAS